MRKIYILLFLLIGNAVNLIGNKDERISKMDSLEHKLIGTKGQERMDMLWTLGRHFAFKDLEKTDLYLNEMLTMMEAADTFSRAAQLENYAKVLKFKNWGGFELGNLTRAFRGSIQLDSIAKILLNEGEKIKAHQYLSEASNVRGAMFLVQMQYKNADTEFKRMLDYCLEINDSLRIGYAYLSLGHNALESGNPEEALPYYLKMDSINRAINAQPHSMVLGGFAIGRTYVKLENWEAAKEVLEKTLEYGDQAMYMYKGGVKMNYAGTLFKLGEIDLAYQYILEAIANNEEMDLNHHDLGPCYIILADIEEALNNHEAANEARKKAVEFEKALTEEKFSEELVALQTEYLGVLKGQEAGFKWWYLLMPIGLFSGILIWYLRKPKIIEHQPLEIAWKNEEEEPVIEDPFLDRFLNKVQENIENDSLTVESIAEDFKMSRVQLFKRIKATTGSSPSQIIRKIRLETAERLLIENNTTVSEVAYKVGFTNPNSFSRSFKDHFGKSPRDYLGKVSEG